MNTTFNFKDQLVLLSQLKAGTWTNAEDLVQKEAPEENGGIDSSSIIGTGQRCPCTDISAYSSVLASPPPPPQPHSAPLHPQGLSNCGRSPQELLGSKIIQQYN